MIHCNSCGKKLRKGTTFCTHCGTKKGEKIPQLKHHLILSVVIVVGFVGLMVLLIMFLSQQSGTNDVENILPLIKSEDRLLDIQNPKTSTSSNTEARREGYDINEKPFAEGNFEYEKTTPDFRFVCENPCPVSKSVLDQEFAAISYAVSTLRGLTKADPVEVIMPFEVHASEDTVCPAIDAPAYMNIFTDKNGYSRGKLCFKFDEVDYDRSNFPYSTSVHEVNHLFQYGRFPPYVGENRILTEGLSMILDSFFEKGNERDSFCWQGNQWYSQIAHQTDSVHTKGAALFFELCKQYGFDYNDLPSLFRELDKRGGADTASEFRDIINSIVGADTSQVFRNAGVNV